MRYVFMSMWLLLIGLYLFLRRIPRRAAEYFQWSRYLATPAGSELLP